MNIDKVYVCDIYKLDDISYNNIDCKVILKKGFSLDDSVYTKYKTSFVKTALVCYSLLLGGFVDMETGQFYKLGYPKNIGELFIDTHKRKIDGKDLMNTNKKYYSKKLILKRYNEYKNGDNNEC